MLRTLFRKRNYRLHAVCGGTVTPVHPTLDQALRDEFFCEECNHHYVPYATTVLLNHRGQLVR